MNQSLQYLLDTDTCIYLLNGNQCVKDRVAQVGVLSIAVAVVTKGELYFGAYNSSRVEKNLERVREFFTDPGPAVLPIDEKVIDSFGRAKAELRRTGQPIGDIDLLIAGVALCRGLTLVSNNIKHFARISGLALENWVVEPSEDHA